MGTNVYYGRAYVDPDAPDTIGICDRCANLWHLRDLQFQYEWQGPNYQNTFLRVCPDCMDIPNPNLRTIVLPPDPEPVYNVRVPNFELMERNEYVIRAAGLGVSMFQASSSFNVELTLVEA